MSLKPARLTAATVGVLLAMTVTTGSTQAQQSSSLGSVIDSAVTSWAKPAPERVVPLPLRPQMCEEFIHSSSKKPFKG